MNKIEITNNAQDHIASILEKDSASYFRITVLGGGCAGFKYDWGFIDTKDKVGAEDITEDWGTGRFVVDDASILYVTGTQIDYKEEVFGSQFEISNPNSKSSCGCGESFGV